MIAGKSGDTFAGNKQTGDQMPSPTTETHTFNTLSIRIIRFTFIPMLLTNFGDRTFVLDISNLSIIYHHFSITFDKLFTGQVAYGNGFLYIVDPASSLMFSI